MILDLGCGTSKYHYSLKGKNIIHVDINKNAQHIDIQCDAYNLPFRNGVFSTVYASHILEHLNEPIKAIEEMKKVSSKRVIIRIPNASFFKWKNSSTEHIFSWNQYTLRNLLQRYFKQVQINETKKESSSRQQKLLSIILTLFHGNNELTAVCSI